MTYAPQALNAAVPRDYCLGVDLGTTFVAAAICEEMRPEMVTLGGRSVVIPSAVYLDHSGRLLCGEAAVHRSVSEPTRAARGFFKRRLGDPTPLRMGGQTRSVTELLAALLIEVLRVVTEMEGAPPREVVLTHPANWGPLRRRIFAEVAALAGLGGVPTTTEPEAAAAHYATSRNLPDGRLVAVYDLGGGTFDATVLRARGGGVEIVGVPEGIERLGGIDFDNALFTHLDFLCDGALSSLDANDARAAMSLARLEQDIVLAKEHLSVDARARVPVFLPERTFDVVLTRAVFEDLIRAHVESTVVALQRTLGSAGVTPEELDAILLVGGSSRIPLVAQMLTEALGRPVAVDTHPKYAVALGAATLAAQLPARVPNTVEAAPPRLVGVGEPARSDSELVSIARLTTPIRTLVLAGGGRRELGGLLEDDHPTDVWPAGAIGLVAGTPDPDPDEVVLWERHDLGDGDGEEGGGNAPVVLVSADGVLTEAGRRRRSGVPAKLVAAAVALLGTGAVGYWAHRSGEPPIMDVAAPVQSCAGDCVSALAAPSAPRSTMSDPLCSSSATGCETGAPAASPVSRNPAAASAPRAPVQARGGAVPAIPPVAPNEDVSAQRQAGGYRSAPELGSSGKTAQEKKSSKKSSEKKSGGKHRSGGSDPSPILGGIV